ncbi:hypothetical protein A7975_19920 [Bacillus sp. FJAT-26390]|nr:hypothetical protein A7975_19920 [Bacillus sp. FJAT-26390]
MKIDEKIRTERGASKLLFKFLLNGIRFKEYIKLISSRASLQKSMIDAYYNALNKILAPVEAVIPMCFPMEAVVAGMKFKKNVTTTKLIPYLFDPFVESHTLHRAKWNKRLKRKANLKVEKNMFDLSTKVFCVNHMLHHFDKFSNSHGRIISTEHPMLKENINNLTINREGENKAPLILTYTGVFDKVVRNPDYLLKTMQFVLSDYDSELHLYTSGNCGDIIDPYTKEAEGKIVNHGYVSKKDADIAVASSGILVSVGNRDNLQSPSKVFEYISAGKPIVHFYNRDDDSIVDLLKSYPISLCLKQDKGLIEQNAKSIIKFYQECNGKTLKFSEIEYKFRKASPKYIASQILNIIIDKENENESKELM